MTCELFGPGQPLDASKHYIILPDALGTGKSMGGMQAWVWATKSPDMMDAVVPTACQPGAMSGRNWILRRLLADSIRNDPDWNNGNLTEQSRNMQRLLTYFSIATGRKDATVARAQMDRAGEE